jgi:predicted ATPase/transcriptional regulator with XRE-family HTH domain
VKRAGGVRGLVARGGIPARKVCEADILPFVGRYESGPAGTGEVFAERLRSLREAAGLTQEELAFRAGLSPSAVGVLERGARKRPYPHTVRALAEALGLDEEGRTSLLAAVPKRGEVGAGSSSAGEPPQPVRSPALPNPTTTLVGRELELEEVAALLARPGARLLTLTGTGGVGKTRLAVEAARVAAHRFPDGVFFVGLAPLADPDLVIPTIARSLGAAEAEGRTPLEALQGHLQGKKLLLVLDNLEHLLDAAVGVAGLIEACPGLVVLATSRAPLRVRGEQEYPVPPLTLPSSTVRPSEVDVTEAPSGRLFLERARAVSPAFAITQENAGAVAAICWRLAGLPLALELAAAKARFMDPETLLARLDRALGTAWTRDLPERQRTMQATLDWSHDLLAGEERALFRRLSVFSGGFTLEAAEEVCAFGEIGPEEILELLARLTEHSLVTVSTDADGTRYGMLKPLRQYALERLKESGESAAARERHAARFLALAEGAQPHFLGPEYQVWSGRLEREHDNLRDALRFAREAGDLCSGFRLVGALSLFWWMRGYLEEGRRWVEGFLSEPFDAGRAGCEPARAWALWAAGALAFGQGDLVRASGRFEESLVLYRRLGDDTGIASVLAEFGQVARSQGDHDRATVLSEEGLELARRLGDPRAAAIALGTLGRLERHRGNPEEAMARYEESLALFRGLGHEWGSAYTLANVADAALGRGEPERALALGQESLSIYEALGDRSGMALALVTLGDVARERGDEERAGTLYEEALDLYKELGNERGAARALARLETIR